MTHFQPSSRHFSPGSRVTVYESGIVAGMAARYQMTPVTRTAVVERAHTNPSGPGPEYFIIYEDDGTSDLIADAERLRLLPPEPSGAA